MTQTRRLILVPIIHAQADFGSLQGKIPVDKEVEEMIQKYWDNVSHYVQSLPVDYTQ